jgi:hypothetical protein
MEAHASHALRAYGRTSRERVAGSLLLKVGAVAGLAGGMMMAMWQMVVGAIAQNPTYYHGIHTSFWTAVTSIPSVLFGPNWFHGSFEFGSVFLGLMGHMMNSMVLGVVAVALATTLLGRRPSIASAMAFGMMFGVILELVIVELLVNEVLQTTHHTLYNSTPHWSWWVSHILFGATTGLVASTLLRRNARNDGRALSRR